MGQECDDCKSVAQRGELLGSDTPFCPMRVELLRAR